MSAIYAIVVTCMLVLDVFTVNGNFTCKVAEKFFDRQAIPMSSSQISNCACEAMKQPMRLGLSEVKRLCPFFNKAASAVDEKMAKELAPHCPVLSNVQRPTMIYNDTKTACPFKGKETLLIAPVNVDRKSVV